MCLGFCGAAIGHFSLYELAHQQKPSPPQPLLTLFHPCRSKISSLAEVFSASPLDAPSVPAALPVLRQPAAARGDHAATGLKSAPRFWLWHRPRGEDDGTQNAS